VETAARKFKSCFFKNQSHLTAFDEMAATWCDCDRPHHFKAVMIGQDADHLCYGVSRLFVFRHVHCPYFTETISQSCLSMISNHL